MSRQWVDRTLDDAYRTWEWRDRVDTGTGAVVAREEMVAPLNPRCHRCYARVSCYPGNSVIQICDPAMICRDCQLVLAGMILARDFDEILRRRKELEPHVQTP